MPINKRGGADHVIWSLTENGLFTMNSIYKAMMQIKQGKVGKGSNAKKYSAIWHTI